MSIEKINNEIAKTEAKIAEMQSRLRGLNKQKTQAENLEIIALVRSIDIPRSELAAALTAIMKEKAAPPNKKTGDKPEHKEENA